MRTITISGVIDSWELDTESNVTPATLKKSLEDANGEDLLITINSPGGSVYHGLEMYSAIRNYPGHTETRIISFAASMGSILALAGDKMTIESTAMFFIHNAWGCACGDYRAMAKASTWLQDVSGLLANMYAERTTLTKEEAEKLMDEESQFYGKELADLGFDIVNINGGNDRATARVIAMGRLKECEAKIPAEEFMKDWEKVAASIAGNKTASVNIIDIQNTVNPFRNSAKLVDEPWDKAASETRWRQHANIESNEDLPNNTYSKRFSWYNSENTESFGAYKFPIFDYKESEGGEFINVAAVRNGLARLSQSDIPTADQDRVRGVLERYLEKWQEQEGMANIPARGNNKTEAKMNFDEYLNGSPEAKQEFENRVSTAVNDAVTADRVRTEKLLVLGGINLSDGIITAIKTGQTSGEFAEAELERRNKNVSDNVSGKSDFGKIVDGQNLPKGEDDSASKEEDAKNQVKAYLEKEKIGGRK